MNFPLNLFWCVWMSAETIKWNQKQRKSFFDFRNRTMLEQPSSMVTAAASIRDFLWYWTIKLTSVSLRVSRRTKVEEAKLIARRLKRRKKNSWRKQSIHSQHNRTTGWKCFWRIANATINTPTAPTVASGPNYFSISLKKLPHKPEICKNKLWDTVFKSVFWQQSLVNVSNVQ